jgi:hypothetical protein
MGWGWTEMGKTGLDLLRGGELGALEEAGHACRKDGHACPVMNPDREHSQPVN